MKGEGRGRAHVHDAHREEENLREGHMHMHVHMCTMLTAKRRTSEKAWSSACLRGAGTCCKMVAATTRPPSRSTSSRWGGTGTGLFAQWHWIVPWEDADMSFVSSPEQLGNRRRRSSNASWRTRGSRHAAGWSWAAREATTR